MKKIFIMILITSAVAGCYYDKENLLYPPGGPCDVSIVTYSQTINQILSSNGCMNCHTGNSPSGNISLQGYANVKAVSSNGKLFGAISHSPGFSPMPQGGNKMSACDINRIKAWIDGGALNN